MAIEGNHPVAPNVASHTCSNWTWLFRTSQAKTATPAAPEVQGWFVFWLFWGFFYLLSSLLQFPHLVKFLRAKLNSVTNHLPPGLSTSLCSPELPLTEWCQPGED